MMSGLKFVIEEINKIKYTKENVQPHEVDRQEIKTQNYQRQRKRACDVLGIEKITNDPKEQKQQAKEAYIKFQKEIAEVRAKERKQTSAQKDIMTQKQEAWKWFSVYFGKAEQPVTQNDVMKALPSILDANNNGRMEGNVASPSIRVEIVIGFLAYLKRQVELLDMVLYISKINYLCL